MVRNDGLQILGTDPRPVLLFVLFYFSSIFAVAQEADSLSSDTSGSDRILLMNGKELEGRILEEEEGKVTYKYLKRGDWKTEALAKYRIYSLNPEGEEERILYEQDSAIGNDLSRDQMGNFILGERDAMQGYRAPYTMAGGLVLGAVGAYALEWSVFTLTIPLVYTLGATAPKIRVDKSTVSDQDLLESDHYLKGYEREARSKRLFNALKGSVGGIVIGMVTYAIVNPQGIR